MTNENPKQLNLATVTIGNHRKGIEPTYTDFSPKCIVDFTHRFLEEMEALAEKLYPDLGCDTDTIVHDVLFSSLVFRMIISQGFTKTEFIDHFNNELDEAISLHEKLDEEEVKQ